MSNHKPPNITELAKKTLQKYPRVFQGVGVLTICGMLVYEKHRLQQLISSIVDSKPKESEKKRPEYIYIKYHIYKESMRRKQEEEEEGKKWINVIINPVGKWWKGAKHSVAWRLLRIAQTGTQQQRLKAVRNLVLIDHLKDWDFRHLAQICDARTAVSLARCGADSRWFLPLHMHGIIKNPKVVLADLREALERLRPNSCVEHFFNKYFPVVQHDDNLEQFFSHEQSFSSEETGTLKEVISFLHHITKDPQTAEAFMMDGGLLHLIELLKIFSNDNETLSTLCKILANMSLIESSVDHFFYSGWISVLATWMSCPDLRLQVISAKVMANLDHDDPHYTQYAPNVYPLYPRWRNRHKPTGDIIFVHGLLGGVFITWRQRDRKQTELGLYGKNAFYTSEADDIFLIGETKRGSNGKGQQNGKPSEKLEGKQNWQSKRKEVDQEELKRQQHEKMHALEVMRANTVMQKTSNKNSTEGISDLATKELVETLQSSAELDPDWEVVHPDVPIKANENCSGEFSVSGEDWLNQDQLDEYTNCWPMEWLPDDQPATRIIGIDYTSAVTEWSANFSKYCPCEKHQGHIEVRANSLLDRIVKADVGNNRPVVWIGHSMGGILTKLMLMRAVDEPDEKYQQLARNTRGLVFLGTPHRGSSIAKWKQHMQMLLSPSIEVKEMEENAPRLLELHKRFMHCLDTCFRNVKVVSIVEGSPTMLTSFKFPLRIVTEESARIDYGDFYMLKDDHLSLSKPMYRQSFLYQRLLQVIDEALRDLQKLQDEDTPMSHEPLYLLEHKQEEPESMSTYKRWLNSVTGALTYVPKVTYKYLSGSMDA